MKIQNIYKLSIALVLGLTTMLSGCSLFMSDSRSPEQILQDMMIAFTDVESYAFDIQDAKIQVSTPEGSGDFNMSAAGKMAQRGREFDMNIGVSGKADLEGESGNLAVDLGMINIAGEDQDQLYIKLNELKLPAEIEQEAGFFMLAIKGMQGQWYGMPPTMLPTDMGALKGSEDAEKREKIKELIKKYQLFNVSKDHGTEDGLRHLEVKLNVKDFVKYMREAVQIMAETNDLPDMEDMSDAEIDEAMKGFEYNLHFWIDMDNSLANKVTLNASGDKEGTTFELVLDANMSDYNADQGISAPAESKSIMELMQNMPLPGLEEGAGAGGFPADLPDMPDLPEAVE